MGILLLEYTEGADHPRQLPYGLKWNGTRMYMGAGGDGPPIWAYLTNIPFPYG